MTVVDIDLHNYTIIPYQELLGNYDRLPAYDRRQAIIPYQELLGNYDDWRAWGA